MELSCTLSANPDAHEYTWLKGNEMIAVTEKGSYTFRAERKDNHSEYACMATNSVDEKVSLKKKLAVQFSSVRCKFT